MMEFYVQPVGIMQANAYVVFNPKRDDAVVIDPGAEPEAIRLALRGRKLAAILLTHGHMDHIGAVGALRSEDVPVFLHEGDAAMLTNPNLNLAVMVGVEGNQGEPDFCLQEGDTELSGLMFTVLHTPGHTKGSVCYLCDGVLFSGDTLFKAGIGRTDFPGGDRKAMRASLKRLAALDAKIRVCPGHGGETTIGAERRYIS
ncbi:MAG: MBL fold metallo-hydrolase [Firmicutes bacterium]|nr:MBL fold metallo-hydrolase [Bacillota bacterium]